MFNKKNIRVASDTEEGLFEKCFDCSKEVNKSDFNNNGGYCDECWNKRQPPNPDLKVGKIF